MGLKILREVTQTLCNNKAKRLRVRANPRVADFIKRNKRDRLLSLEKDFERPVLVIADPDMSTEDFEIERIS
jgi:Ribonuclease G/E